MKFIYKAFITLTLTTLTLTSVSCANTFPEASEPLLLINLDGQNDHLNGIGQIYIGDRRYCTAFLLDTRDANNNATGPAYILTNAHCASIRVGTAVDTAYYGQMQFNYFHDTLAEARRYDIHKVKWASLAGSDIAILELNHDLASLIDDGINPLKAAAIAPDEPRQVKVIGAPSSAPGLRRSTCTQEPADTTLIKYLAVHTRYQKQDCKGIEPGSSGSPVMDVDTGEVTGVMSGTTYGIVADDLCFWNGLCGPRESRSLLPDQASQSFPIDYLLPCFNNGRFNIDALVCPLKPNFNFRTRSVTDIALHKVPIAPSEATPNWAMKFSMNTDFFRYKSVRDAQTCYFPEHYSNPISTHSAVINAPIGREAGLYYLCMVGVDSAEQQLTVRSLKNAQILSARLVSPVSIRLPEPAPVLSPGNEDLLIEYRKNEDRNIWTRVYAGPANTTDCSTIDPKNYSKIGDSFLVPNGALPLTLCSYTEDRNLSTSDVRTDDLPRPQAD